MAQRELFVTKNIHEYLNGSDKDNSELDIAIYTQISPYVDYYMTNHVCLYNGVRLVSVCESRVFTCLDELTNFLAEKHNDGYVVFLREIFTTITKEFKFCGCFYERKQSQNI